MDPAAEELHYTRHFAAKNNWKRKCAMEPSFRRFCGAREIVIYDYIGNPKCFAAGPHAPGKSHAGRKSSPLRGINKALTFTPGAYQTSAHRSTFASASTYHSPPTSQLIVSQID